MTRSLLFRVAAPLAACATVPFLLFAGGCGSGDGRTFTTGTGIITPSPSPSATPASTTRYYQSTFPLAAGGTAVVNLTALADGSASGTLTLNDGRAASVATSRVVIGTGNLSGTVNFGTGAVNVTGTVTVTGTSTQNGVSLPISITGTAPGTSGTGGTANLMLGTTNVTAQWVVSTTGPIASNGNNGGNATGGASAITFSSNSSNITPGNLNAAVATAIKQTLPFVGDILTISAADVVNGTPRAVSVVLFGTAPTVGQTYDLANGDGTTGVTYSEGNGSVKTFVSSGGTITVTSVSGKTYTLKLSGVKVDAQTGNPAFTGTGSVTIDGTITATLP